MDFNVCIIDSDISLDTPICQYLDLDYFMSIILRNKYCVRQKGFFIDKRESSIFSKWMFPIRPAKESGESDHLEMGTLEEMNRKLKDFSDTKGLYTSCWTLDENEKFFMWQTYASKLGIRMLSTVGDFIQSIELCADFNKISCHKIKYKTVTFYDNMQTYLTTKDMAFADEKEFRFYFHNDTNESAVSKIFVPVNYSILIKKVTISPFVESVTSNWLIKYLLTEFNIKAYQSEIQLNK